MGDLMTKLPEFLRAENVRRFVAIVPPRHLLEMVSYSLYIRPEESPPKPSLDRHPSKSVAVASNDEAAC